MRISGYGNKGVEAGQETKKTKAEGKAEGKRATRSAAEPNSEKVEVSARARESAKAKEIAMSAPDVDEAKVNRLREAIHSGAYKVDGKAVADKMVDEHIQHGL